MDGTQEPLTWPMAMFIMVGTGALLVASGWFVISIAHRAADGRLGPNRWLGTRTRTTRSSPETWQTSHLAALPPSILAGRVFMGSALVALLGVVSGDPETAIGIWGVLIGVGVLLASGILLYAAWLAQQTAKRHVAANNA